MTRPRRTRRPLGTAIVASLVAAALVASPWRGTADAHAARGAVGHGGDAGRGDARVPGRVAVARLQYGGGGDWYANPSALRNLLRAVRTRTALPVDTVERTVTLRDPAVMDYDVLHVTGHGTMSLEPDEIAKLRQYVLQGGFVHVDDNYGLDSSFRRIAKQAFPDRPLVDVPLTHPVYRLVYDFPKGLPKIHEHDGKPARGFGIFVGDRLALYYSYSADLGNGWEDVGTYRDDPPALHEQALRMGVNLVAYAVTSRVLP
jgi:hypothetical protein